MTDLIGIIAAVIAAIIGAALIWRQTGSVNFDDLPTKIGLLLIGGVLATVAWGCMVMRNTGYSFLAALQSVHWWVLGTWLALAATLFVSPSADD